MRHRERERERRGCVSGIETRGREQTYADDIVARVFFSSPHPDGASRRPDAPPTQAATTIYAGSHRGLTSRARAPLSLSQSALLPLCAAGGLGVVYLLLTLTDLDITTFTRVYFFILSSVAITAAAAPPLRHVTRGAGLPTWNLDVPEGWLIDVEGDSITSFPVSPTDLAAAVAAVAIAAADAATGHTNFTLSNACAVAVCADVLRLLGFRSFRAAAAALIGLALYDVAAVFATSHLTHDGQSVMATVALSDAFAGPTRLLFPRDGVAAAAAASIPDAPIFPHSLLGLGDVAVPVIFAALALRFDASRAVDMPARAAAAAAAIDAALANLPKTLSDREIGEVAADAAAAAYDGVADGEQAARDAAVGEGGGTGGHATPPPTAAVLSSRPYFGSVMIAYAIGLGAAFAINSATRAAQPALLYLVPATLGGVAALAVARGDVGRLAAFTDAAPSVLEAGKQKQ